MRRIVHVISSLGVGGAEMMLFKLLGAMEGSGYKSTVVSLTDHGPIGDKIEKLGVDVFALGMRRGVPSLGALMELFSIIRRNQPDLVQTWMYHSDLMGGVAAKLAGNAPIVWGLHHSNLEPEVNKRSTILTSRICAALSRWVPERIVCCSKAAKEVHEKLGYASDRMIIIPNGFDLDVFRPDPDARASVREELGIDGKSLLAGLVGRFHPQKDLRNFVMAASRLSCTHPAAHYLMCGDGIIRENPELAGWIRESGFQDRFHLLGRRDDIPRLLASLDFGVSSSCGEGFPTVVGETMSCGVPCVVTDVGDSGWIVSHTGMIVPPRDPEALARAMDFMIRAGEKRRRELGLQARQSVLERFSLRAVASQYEALYRQLVPVVRNNP